jgi:DNA repair protein RadC
MHFPSISNNHKCDFHVALAHNHPSGVAEPSIQDQALTRTLAEAAALVDVKILDHFVVAGSVTLSFAARGLL